MSIDVTGSDDVFIILGAISLSETDDELVGPPSDKVSGGLSSVGGAVGA